MRKKKGSLGFMYCGGLLPLEMSELRPAQLCHSNVRPVSWQLGSLAAQL